MKALLDAIGLTKLEDFEFVKKIGKGKASVVCLYENPEGAKKAVKVLIAPRSDEELYLFKKEPEILSKLNKNDTKNIPIVFSGIKSLNELQVHYYVMEYIDGITLEEFILDTPLPWNVTQSIKMIACIVSALSKTSSQLVVHRDLHPGNIILERTFDYNEQYTRTDVDIKILDYGCHKEASSEFFGYYFDSENNEKPVTKRNDYMRHFGAVSSWSPEFLMDPYSVNIYHDIWALGVLLFGFLTNDYPLRANSFSDLYENLVSEFKINWELIEERNIHWAVKKLLCKMLSQNPKERCLHDDIVKICIGLASKSFYEKPDSFIQEFLSRNGDLWICPICSKEVYPNGNRCTACGRMVEDSREWINPFAG